MDYSWLAIPGTPTEIHFWEASELDIELATYTLEDKPRALQAIRRDPVLVSGSWCRVSFCDLWRCGCSSSIA